ncbi:hypothetical protein FOCC_FOCC016183 [Frankliniella occidentalis]|nr:hypothetical protein FOCC_FOCC016183 [Frankliniella occidentalis]
MGTPRLRFDNFQPGEERWVNYERRLRYALDSAGFETDAAKKKAFLGIVNNKIFDSIEHTLYPRSSTLADVTFEAIVDALKTCFQTLEPSPVAAEQDFGNRVQQEGETVDVWLADLRRLASICGFSAASLPGRLRTQLIKGTTDVEARAKLIRKAENATLEKVVSTLRSYERSKLEMGRTGQGQPSQPWVMVNSAAALSSTSQPTARSQPGPARATRLMPMMVWVPADTAGAAQVHNVEPDDEEPLPDPDAPVVEQVYALHNRFENFQPGEERWVNYERRLLYALEAAGFEEDAAKKKAFLGIVNNKIFDAIEDTLYPRSSTLPGVTFEAIVAALRKCFQTLEPSPVAAEQSFCSRVQQEGETLNAWLADLRRLASICGFSEASLPGRLQTQLIKGTVDAEARAKLMRKENVTLEKVIRTLRGYERSKVEMGRMGQGQPAQPQPWVMVNAATALPSTSQPTARSQPGPARATRLVPMTVWVPADSAGAAQVHNVAPDDEEPLPDPDAHVVEQVYALQSQSGAPCKGCGAQHDRSECPYWRTVCHACQRTGHISRVCESTGQGQAGTGRPAANTRVDAATNWIDAYWVNSPSSAAVIQCLRRAFATHGRCDTIVADNAPCFKSKELEDFLEDNGIKKLHSPPYFRNRTGLQKRQCKH